MIDRLLADALVVVHLAFVLFVVFGALAVRRWPRLAWLHLPALAWGAGIEFASGICPLTPLENLLRRRGGQAGYTVGFVDHYLLPALYPAGLTPRIQSVLGAAVLLFNAAVYGWCLAAWRRRAVGTQR